MIITLNNDEIRFAKSVGNMWVQLGVLNGYHKHGTIQPEQIIHINERGALAEYAASKLLKLKWNYSDPVKREADIGMNTNVCSTDILSGNLIIEAKQPLDRFYILVIQMSGGSYDVVGYISGETDKKQWRDDLPKPAWFISRYDLKDCNGYLCN